MTTFLYACMRQIIKVPFEGNINALKTASSVSLLCTQLPPSFLSTYINEMRALDNFRSAGYHSPTFSTLSFFFQSLGISPSGVPSHISLSSFSFLLYSSHRIKPPQIQICSPQFPSILDIQIIVRTFCS